MSLEFEKSLGKQSPAPVAGSGRFFYGYAIVIASFCIWLVQWGSLQSFGVFYKPLTEEFGWSRAETALALSMVSVVHAAAAIIMGSLTDRIGPRIIVTIIGSLVGISYLLLSQMNSLGQFYFYYAVVGALGMSPGSVPIMATISRWFVKRRAMMVAIVQAGVGIGGFVFAPFSAWMIVSYGWRQAYEATGVIVLVVGIISGLILKRDPQSVSQFPDGIARTETSPAPTGTGKGAPGLSLGKAAGTQQFWIAVGLFSCFGFCRSAFLPHIANHVQDLGFSISDGANVMAVLTVFSIVGRVWLGCVENRLAFVASFAVTTVSLIWALFARELWGLYLFAIVFAFGWGAQAVLRFTVTAEIFGLRSIGLLLGVLGFCEAAAGGFGTYFSGLLFDVSGSYQLAFWISIPVSALGIILALLIKPISPEDYKEREQG